MCIARINGNNNEEFEGETSMTTAHTFFEHLTSIGRVAALLLLMTVTACNNSGGSSTGPADLSLFAGNLDSKGNVDGTGSTARFVDLRSGAFDTAGNLYVADTSNHTIRKITPAGVVTTFAGLSGYSGSADGTGPLARFNTPFGIATDGANNIYVADTNNNSVRKITPTGVVSTLATGLSTPRGVTTDATGTNAATNVFVANSGNHLILAITNPGGVVSTFAGVVNTPGTVEGAALSATFSSPYDVAFDKTTGILYVTNTGTNSIRAISAGTVSTIATGFNSPQGITADGAGNVFVADTNNHIIRKIVLSGAVISTLAGTSGAYGSANGIGASASFYSPIGVAVDITGNVYVADTRNWTIRKITSAGAVSNFAGIAGAGRVDGSGSAAGFDNPQGVASDRSGNLYVADTSNHTIRKITPSGAVSIFAGQAGFSGSQDGAGTTSARFNSPAGVAVDSADNLYVADTGNNTIRKIPTTGSTAGTVSTIAGLALTPEYLDGGIVSGVSTARFNAPRGLTTDSAGNIYVVDRNNQAIRKITPDGTVSTFAGTFTIPVASKVGTVGSTDGKGTTVASFNYPWGITADSVGNLYVTDNGNNTIRKITPDGDVTTIAGKAGIAGSVDGGGVARFNYPTGIVTDSSANIFVADYFNHVIRKITPTGIVSTVVGVAGNGGFTAGTLPGVISFPVALSFNGSSLYIAMSNGVAVVKNFR
jgi:DNA-binding beta-propeller fold protein YncE